MGGGGGLRWEDSQPHLRAQGKRVTWKKRRRELPVTTGLWESEVPSVRAPGIGYILGQNEQACPARPPPQGPGIQRQRRALFLGGTQRRATPAVRVGARCPCPALSHRPAVCVAAPDSGSLRAPSPTLPRPSCQTRPKPQLFPGLCRPCPSVGCFPTRRPGGPRALGVVQRAVPWCAPAAALGSVSSGPRLGLLSLSTAGAAQSRITPSTAHPLRSTGESPGPAPRLVRGLGPRAGRHRVAPGEPLRPRGSVRLRGPTK